MEQETKQLSFPIKTKIAAWIIIVIGGILGCLCLVVGILGLFFGGEMAGYVVLPAIGIFIGSLLIFLPGPFLLKKKRWAWWFSIIILIIELIILIESIVKRFYVNYPPSIYLVTPIILIKALIILILGKRFYDFSLWAAPLAILFIISFFLLLFDKRNFWKITERK